LKFKLVLKGICAYTYYICGKHAERPTDVDLTLKEVFLASIDLENHDFNVNMPLTTL